MLMAYAIDPAFDGSELSLTMYRYMNLNVDRKNYTFLVSRLKELFEHLEQKAEAELKSLYYELELPLSKVLGDMEYAGIRVDRDILLDISQELSDRIAKDEEKIYELAGSQFNINSPKQLGKILFEDLQLRVIKKTKTGYATGAEVLEELYEEHEIIPLIACYAKFATLIMADDVLFSQVIKPAKINTKLYSFLVDRIKIGSISQIILADFKTKMRIIRISASMPAPMIPRKGLVSSNRAISQFPNKSMGANLPAIGSVIGSVLIPVIVILFFA
jgi:hypothetical protein